MVDPGVVLSYLGLARQPWFLITSGLRRLYLPKEEEIYLPILEARLHPEEVDRLVETMERTVNEAKSSLKAIATPE